MPSYSPEIECPKCGSKDTRFVEPLHEMSVYECSICHARFEVEQGD